MNARETAKLHAQNLTPQELIAELLTRGDDPQDVVLQVARAAGVDVYYEYRETLQDRLDVEFTDEEWAKVKPLLGGLDDRVTGVWGVADAVIDWAMELVHEAGLDLEQLQARKGQPVRTCRGCGCTDNRACVGNGGRPCHWVAADTCSACAVTL